MTSTNQPTYKSSSYNITCLTLTFSCSRMSYVGFELAINQMSEPRVQYFVLEGPKRLKARNIAQGADMLICNELVNVD